MQFANLTHLTFDPMPQPFAVSEAGVSHETPGAHRPTLKDLARLTYVQAYYRYSLELPGETAEVIIRLKAGTTTLAQKTVKADGAGRYDGAEKVFINQTDGDDPLSIEVETVTTDTVEAKIAAVLEVQHPIIISGA